MIQARQLAKYYSARGRSKRASKGALTGIDVDIESGSTTAVFGENGSGKSTLLSLLSGQIDSYQGSLLIRGAAAPHHVQQYPVGYAGESASFPAHLTVKDLLLFNASLQSISGALLDQKLQFVCDQLDLKEIQSNCFATLSKGMKQRVNLAQSLMTDSELLIWDEPTSGLDWKFSQIVADLMQTLQEEQRTVVYSSHNLDLIERTADAVLHLENGKVRYFGPFKNWADALSHDKCEQHAGLVQNLIKRNLSHGDETL